MNSNNEKQTLDPGVGSNGAARLSVGGPVRTRVVGDQVLRPCRGFNSSAGCKYGEKCMFSHAVPESRISLNPSVNITDVKLDSKVVAHVLARPALLKCASLSALLERKTVVVASTELATLAYSRSQGWPVVGLDARSNIPHPLSHVSREVALLKVGAAALRGGSVGLRQGRVLDIYGTERTVRILSMKGYDAKGSKLGSELDEAGNPVLDLKVDIGPDEQYPGDAGKLNGQRVTPKGLYNLVVATDVYWDGTRGPVTPLTIRRWAAHSVDSTVYLITRPFLGEAGCDLIDGYDVAEGVWYKREGMVNFSSDAGGYGYPEHYSLDFLRHKTVDGVSITYVESVGPYHVYKCTVEPVWTIPVPVGLQVQASYPVQEMTLHVGAQTCAGGVCSRIANAVGLTYGTQTVMVHSASFFNLVATYGSKIPTGHIYDGCLSQVRESLKGDLMMSRMQVRYPSVYGSILEGTAQAIMYSGRRDRSRALYTLRLDHIEAEEELTKARTPSLLSLATPRNYWKALCVALTMWFFLTWAQNLGAHAYVLDPVDAGGVGGEWWLIAIIVAFFGMIGISSLYRLLCPSASVSRYLQWSEARARGEDADVGSGIETLPEGIFIPAVQCLAMPPRIMRGTMRVELDGVIMSPGEAFEVLKGEEVRCRSYPVAVTSGMLSQPDKSDTNLLAACAWRIHAEVVGESDEVVLQMRWDKACTNLADAIGDRIREATSIEACAKLMGGVKGRNLLESWRKLEGGLFGKARKEVMVKWNETICLKYLNGEWTVKPRAITVLSNELHVQFAPDARGVANLLHSVFDGSLINGIHVYFASGYHGEELNEVGRMMYKCESVIAVSGDDCAACMPNAMRRSSNGIRAIWKEGDFSAFDQSQRAACLKGHGLWMAKLGIPVFYIRLMIHVCSAPYVAKGRRVVVRGDAGAELATGIDWTTIINSMSNLVFWFRVFLEDGDPEEIAKEMGLSIKFKEVHDFFQLTFLKGWWQYDQTLALCWYPLPSQVVKLGKTLKEPRLFSKYKKDPREGVRVLAYAIAQSFPNVPERYPLLGPFLAMLRRTGKDSGSVVSASEDGWYKPQVAAVSVDRGEILSSVTTRYGLTIVDILRAEELMDSVRELPVFLADPVFSALRNVDYC